jgi:hypothetical protein
MSTIGKTLKGYIWWTYPRGSVHFDVMVTAILLFIFVAPRFIDFHAKPVPNVPIRSSEVLVKSIRNEGNSAQFVYEVRVEDLNNPQTDSDLKAALLRVIEPIAGSVTLERFTPVTDTKGRTVAYDATVLR